MSTSKTNGFRRTGVILTIALVLLTIGGCRSPRNAGDEDGERRRARERMPILSPIGLELTPEAEAIRSVQLYASGSQTNLPIARVDVGAELSSPQVGERLVLEFDRIGTNSGPLEIEFRHFDRLWNPDYLQPSQILARFDVDVIVDYALSRATRQSYTHYRYDFPNDNIRFLVSGNYTLRVFDRSDPDVSLVVRPFVLVENEVEVSFSVTPTLVPGLGAPLGRPVARLRFPESLSNNAFDFRTCFIRNARFDLARCVAGPSLFEPPFLQFYLDPRVSFEAQEPVYSIDLSLLQPGARIRSVDYSADPYRVQLEPDYADLATGSSSQPLYGQSEVSSISSSGPADLTAEYVVTAFEFVPPENERGPDHVYLVGSFNFWNLASGFPMTWNQETRSYTGEALIKQGRYEYQYRTADPERGSSRRRGVFNPDQAYSALVYFSDPHLRSDRLIGRSTVISR